MTALPVPPKRPAVLVAPILCGAGLVTASGSCSARSHRTRRNPRRSWPGQYPMGQAMTASFCSAVTNSRTSEEQMSTIAKGLNHATMWRSRRTRATRKPQQLDASSD